MLEVLLVDEQHDGTCCNKLPVLLNLLQSMFDLLSDEILQSFPAGFRLLADFVAKRDWLSRLLPADPICSRWRLLTLSAESARHILFASEKAFL